MVVDFRSIAPDEERFIVKGMADLGSTRRPDGYVIQLKLDTTGHTVDELCAEIRRIHATITAIRNDRNTEIASHAETMIRLIYVSSKAVSDGQATVIIKPIPLEARLFIDTKLPTPPSVREDGSVVLNTPDGQFWVSLPFSYIRRTDRIYFRTVFVNTTRYFYYDVDKQLQEEVGGILTAEDWEYYMKNRRLPPR